MLNYYSLGHGQRRNPFGVVILTSPDAVLAITERFAKAARGIDPNPPLPPVFSGALVEMAPFQGGPDGFGEPKVDALRGTIEGDEDYVKFKQSLQEQREIVKMDTEAMIAAVHAQRQAADVKITPLVEHLKAIASSQKGPRPPKSAKSANLKDKQKTVITEKVQRGEDKDRKKKSKKKKEGNTNVGVPPNGKITASSIGAPPVGEVKDLEGKAIKYSTKKSKDASGLVIPTDKNAGKNSRNFTIMKKESVPFTEKQRSPGEKESISRLQQEMPSPQQQPKNSTSDTSETKDKKKPIRSSTSETTNQSKKEKKTAPVVAVDRPSENQKQPVRFYTTNKGVPKAQEKPKDPSDDQGVPSKQ